MRLYIIDKLKAYTGGIWANIAHQADGQTISELLNIAIAAAKHDVAKAVQSSVFRPFIATVNL
jgi:hypothetical protein